ncbi:MAG: DUF1990 domain-containing protein [Planctomycetaceae bacterium]|nr:DUF1990 domain-containing protein [Planctomycetaceae bacterium]
MFQLTRPKTETIREWALSLEEAPFNYSEHPLFGEREIRGYDHSHVSVEMGEGVATFEAGQTAFREWKMFPSEMVDLVPLRDEISIGNIVTVVARGGGLWSYNACRIFEVINNDSDTESLYGFTYATLPGHVARGEERFLLRYDRTTGKVFYEIEVYSRPDHWLVKMIAPYFRFVQRKFRRLSQQAIKRAIQSSRDVSAVR